MEVKSLGHGQFTVSNGEDTIIAKYVRGKKGKDGRFHPCWSFDLNGFTWTASVSKEDAVRLSKKVLVEPYEFPMSREAALAFHRREGCVHGVVAVELGEIIHRDLEEFLDLINERLSEVPLCEISYRVVEISDDGLTLYIRVNGLLDHEESEKVIEKEL